MSKCSKTHLRFTLPIHTNSTNEAHNYQRYSANDSRVIGSVVEDLYPLFFQQIVHRVTETNRIHTGWYGVGKCEDNTHRCAEFWPERSWYYVVNSSCGTEFWNLVFKCKKFERNWIVSSLYSTLFYVYLYFLVIRFCFVLITIVYGNIIVVLWH